MRSVFITLLMVTVSAGYAQCPAAASFILPKKKKENPYSVSSQSGSAAIKPGETYELSMIATPGMDYRLSAALADPSDGSLSYQVYELVVEKNSGDGASSYKKNKHVLANSSLTTEPLEFSTEKSRKIFVAVTMTGGDVRNPACVGVLIENKKSVRLGF